MTDPKKELIVAIKSTNTPHDIEKISQAWEFANLAHSGQLRKSGEPFINHPTETAKILVSWGLDDSSIIGGILHDTIEDGGATRDDIVSQFGEEIALLVDGVTKISDIRLKGSAQDLFVENLRKMLLVMAKDVRVVLIKLADRLHNMRTIKILPPEKRKRIANETIDIYAALADRLGMSEIAGEMDDLSFPHAHPEEYDQLVEKTDQFYKDADRQVQKMKTELMESLKTDLPDAKISVREKHMYSLYKKLQRPEIAGDLGRIHDLVAARIITQTVAECYIALGIVHGQYRPVPYLGVSDYIATPKPNGYQSIHTKVFGPDGQIVEIQIRTYDMHEQAEKGVAAHWHYAEAKSKKGASSEQLEKGLIAAPEEKLSWVRQLMSWQKEIADNKEYLNTLKIDAFQNRIMVFSPLGDVYDLPRGATPVDYAYAVHTQLGHQAVGAKVNTKLVSLSHKLNNGDVVEIVIDEKRGKPNRDWLDFVATHTAKSQIAKSLRTNTDTKVYNSK